MTSRTVVPRLAEIGLPDFGMPETTPEIPAATYGTRLEALRERADARGYERLVVYADREHSANMSFLTGFDPRFEEAILVVGPTGPPVILVGNECYGMAGAAPLTMRREMFQDLSLPSQPPRSLEAAGRHLRRRGHPAGQPRRCHRLEDVRQPRDDRGPGLHRRRAAPVGRTGWHRRERQ